MYNVRKVYEEMKCRIGVNKVSWADLAGMALCKLAGDSGQGRVFLLARHSQLHTFALFSVLNFERGEELETALLSISILWPEYSEDYGPNPCKTCRRGNRGDLPLILENGFTCFDNSGCQVYYETSRMGLHPLIMVDVKSTMKHREWVYTL